ncbi:MAG: hypothetical protein HZB59_12935 [Ignavibacteriales bacterium]|nr:hypothetical protein [Ignavibacteriales bacterium]
MLLYFTDFYFKKQVLSKSFPHAGLTKDAVSGFYHFLEFPITLTRFDENNKGRYIADLTNNPPILYFDLTKFDLFI